MVKVKSYIESSFHQFSSIENCNQKHILDLEKNNFIDDQDEWVAMEKIHGANFSFLTDGHSVYTARRRSILAPNDNFFGHGKIAEKYKSDILLVYQKIKSDIPDITTIQIFGEIFGGYYPNLKSSKPVQKGIWYNNEIDFLVFDIKINKNNIKPSGSNETLYWYLSQDEIDTYLANLSQLRGAPVISKGKFQDMIKLNPEFPSTIPMMYLLSPIDNNIAEGYVIKLNKRHPGNITRPIIKLKNKKFLEKTGVKVPLNINSNNKFTEKVIEYCTQNRFNNTISKIGPDNKIEKIQGIFIADAITDMKKDLDVNELEEFEKNIKKVKEIVSYYLFTNNITNCWLNEYLAPISETIF